MNHRENRMLLAFCICRWLVDTQPTTAFLGVVSWSKVPKIVVILEVK